jgi:hypothetical protein
VSVSQDESGYWRVQCGACGASSGVRPASDPDGRDKVLAHWNTRPDERHTAWMLSQIGDKFMVGIEPDGRIRTDGGHSDEYGVAKAKRLHESISCIKPPVGTKWYMLTIDAIPDLNVTVNQDAINTLNGELKHNEQ